ncbi:hypothetical protein HK405_000846, partial [Cladochytrium tenue]
TLAMTGTQPHLPSLSVTAKSQQHGFPVSLPTLQHRPHHRHGSHRPQSQLIATTSSIAPWTSSLDADPVAARLALLRLHHHPRDRSPESASAASSFGGDSDDAASSATCSVAGTASAPPSPTDSTPDYAAIAFPTQLGSASDDADDNDRADSLGALPRLRRSSPPPPDRRPRRPSLRAPSTMCQTSSPLARTRSASDAAVRFIECVAVGATYAADEYDRTSAPVAPLSDRDRAVHMLFRASLPVGAPLRAPAFAPHSAALARRQAPVVPAALPRHAVLVAPHNHVVAPMSATVDSDISFLGNLVASAAVAARPPLAILSAYGRPTLDPAVTASFTSAASACARAAVAGL